MNTFSIKGQLVNIPEQKISPAKITVEDGKITSVIPVDNAPDHYLMPGFIDAHVHVESSMLIPSEFARLAIVHGTVATVSDPHEIANVCGKEGVDFMIENGKKTNFHFYFGAPSCVPATPFETAGGEITAADIDELLGRKEITYLAEMMNWPGVINRDPAVMEKIAIAQKHHKPVDGHAPGLKDNPAEKYISAGISTDHECFTEEEALSKLQLGMKIIIREGSAAKNFEALIDLMDDHADQLMFCSDDKHPDNLVLGHINQLAARAIAKGKNLFDVLKAACINPIAHYQMNVGQLRVGDPADFIVCKDLKDFKILETYIRGQKVAKDGVPLLPSVQSRLINNFNTSAKTPDDFLLKAQPTTLRVIEARDGQLITNELQGTTFIKEGFAEASTQEDILKFAVINRYKDAPPAIAFIKNFGLKTGAIASSVGHDSHNILAVGTDNDSIAKAVNLIIDKRGGISAVSPQEDYVLPLPIGGIMSNQDGFEVAKAYTKIDRLAKDMGSTLESPYMTLSFMALLVIPSLKLSDKGLFDGTNFQFTSPFIPKN
ncbi:adenine deaminase [Echinicola strongylocentroti]|uniref:Adenine deaminase n=1 Tax=Echinicola strongylocentroti TaxID=1795355 RepID=A0A2Z4IM42_9BACT|nr:adenine deaminase [Echinicola strongylocentroti]AWW31453.1 adenine deaminase [Echinicola strongylocentroti]